MKKTFSIHGVGNTPAKRLQSLIEIEPILVMAGYEKPAESWNNSKVLFADQIGTDRSMHCYGSGTMMGDVNEILYLHHAMKKRKHFYANQIDEILNYIFS